MIILVKVKFNDINITNVISITKARDSFNSLVNSIIEFNDVPVLTYKRGNVVLMSYDNYAYLCEIIGKLPDFEDSDIVNVTKAQRNLYNLVALVTENEKIINITNKSGSVALMSWSEYRSLCETAYLCSIPGLMESIEKAANAPRSEFVQMNKIDWDKVDEF